MKWRLSKNSRGSSVKKFLCQCNQSAGLVKNTIWGRLDSNLSQTYRITFFNLFLLLVSHTEKCSCFQILPLVRKHKVVHFSKTDSRLANNGLPLKLQKLRCYVNYNALRFTPSIEALGNKMVSILRRTGSFIVLHLRYEMDMLAFSGCTHGCSDEETEELTRMRYFLCYCFTFSLFSPPSLCFQYSFITAVWTSGMHIPGGKKRK